MNKPTPAPRTGERRESFRVFQDVLFDYQPAEAFAAENAEVEDEFGDSSSISLLNELNRIDKHNNELLKLVGDKNRLLGDYLRGLNNKMDLITRHMLFVRDEPGNSNRHRINLSESGIAFSSERMFYKDSFIALRLIFLPNYIPVISFAKIIRCEAKNEAFHVAARFHRIKASARQELAKRVLKSQITANRKAKSD